MPIPVITIGSAIGAAGVLAGKSDSGNGRIIDCSSAMTLFAKNEAPEEASNQTQPDCSQQCSITKNREQCKPKKQEPGENWINGLTVLSRH